MLLSISEFLPVKKADHAKFDIRLYLLKCNTRTGFFPALVIGF